jgi:hypothetical protein
MEKTANLGEVFNKASVEISKANKASYFFEAFGNRPINDSFNLDWVHRDFTITDN